MPKSMKNKEMPTKGKPSDPIGIRWSLTDSVTITPLTYVNNKADESRCQVEPRVCFQLTSWSGQLGLVPQVGSPGFYTMRLKS